MSSSAKKRVKLTECADILYGFPFDSKLFNSDGVGTPLIRIRDINSGFSDTFTSENTDEKYMVKRGDCVLGMDGNFDIVKWNNVEGYLNQN